MNCDHRPGSGVYGRGVDIGGTGQIISSKDILYSPNVEQIPLINDSNDSKCIKPEKPLFDIFENLIERLPFHIFKIFSK